MSNSAYAVYNTSYELRTPYISSTEYQNSTQAVDTSNLIAGGSAQAQLTALIETIGRASSWVDQFTCGVSGTLAATVETENARIYGSYRSTLLCHPRYWPVIEVQSFVYSGVPGGLAAGSGASVTPSGNITIYPQEFEVAITGYQSSFSGVTGWSGWGTTGVTFRNEYDCQWTYVAGWPQTTLAASVAAGAASIQPSVVTGIYPGTQLTIYEMPYDEPVTVAASYVPGNAVVPLTSNLQFAHTTFATVTNLPPAIKQATILATTAFIKQRGSGALEVSDMGAITHSVPGGPQGSDSDWYQAEELLTPFKQQFVGW